MKTDEYIPDTEIGLNQFVKYCYKQIRLSEKMIEKCNERIDKAIEMARIKGIKLTEIKEKK